jgi:hypothetical protein
LAASRAAYQPRTAAPGGVGKRGIDNLNQLPVPSWERNGSHRKSITLASRM